MRYRKTCVVCGKLFDTNREWQVFCSGDCSDVKHRIRAKKKYYRRRRKEYPPKTPKHYCAVCGKEFTPAFKGEKHCSDECRYFSPAFLAAKILYKLGV